MCHTVTTLLSIVAAQRLAVMDKFKRKIQEQAIQKKIEAGKLYDENHPKDKSLSPNGEHLSKIHTDKEIAVLTHIIMWCNIKNENAVF